MCMKCSVCIVLLMQHENEEVSMMTRVLVGVEMLQCNRNPRHMEFSVPSLSTVCTVLYLCFPTIYCRPDGNNRSQRPLSFQGLFSSHHVSISSNYCSCLDHLALVFDQHLNFFDVRCALHFFLWRIALFGIKGPWAFFHTFVVFLFVSHLFVFH